jgi:hypothetical protein
VSYNLFVANSACGLLSIAFDNYILNRLMLDTVRIKSSKVLVEHAALGPTWEMISFLASFVATANSGSVMPAFATIQLTSSSAFFNYIMLQKTQNTLFICAFLLKSR